MTDGLGGTGVSALLAGLDSGVVGLHTEAEVLAVALDCGRHIMLEGPPGTGKSTLLRHLAGAAHCEVEFVEGNAELTPGRLIGQYDPALVLNGGYREDAFLEGPLVTALRTGAWLYVEELNRVPEETLNVLITVLAEGELHVPRLGRIGAEAGFRFVAAMNPFDAVGTARVSQAIADRICRISVGYQDAVAEHEIVTRGAPAPEAVIAIAVATTRDTRTHPDLRAGSSVRGALDLAALAEGLARIRGADATDESVLRSAARAALSGRIALQDGCHRTPEEIVDEILERVLARHRERQDQPQESTSDDDDRGPPPGPGPDQREEPARPEPAGGSAKPLRGARTLGRHELSQRHAAFDDVSPGVGQLDAAALEELLATDDDAAYELLGDLVRATDPALRALARAVAVRITLRLVRAGPPTRAAVQRLRTRAGAEIGDLDIERSLDRAGGHPRRREDLVLQTWRGSPRRLALVIDHSGSMRGPGLVIASVAGAAVALAARETGGCSVIAFNREARVLQSRGQRRSPDALVQDVLALEGGGRTNVAAGLRAAAAQLGSEPHGGDRTVLLLSDCVATVGDAPERALAGIDRLHVLGMCEEAESQDAGRRLAALGRGHYALVASASHVPRGLRTVLG